MNNLSRVKEVKSTMEISEVNNLIKGNWILLQIVPIEEGLSFILGRLG